MTEGIRDPRNRIRTVWIAAPLALAVVLAALVAGPSDAPAKSDSPGPCLVVLDRSDAGAVLHGLTAGYVEDAAVHPWPQREGRLCTWQGKLAILVLKIYIWGQKDQRREFAKTLCEHELESVCGQWHRVVSQDFPALASAMYADALEKARRLGTVHLIQGGVGFYLDPRRNDLGTDAWGEFNRRTLVQFTCLTLDKAKRGKPQNACAAHAMQRAQINGS